MNEARAQRDDPSPIADASAAHLSLTGLRKTFDGNTFAIDAVSLDIRKGEFVTFLGPSGSGKTTTLSIVAGFTTPTEGDVRLRGASVVDMPPHRRNMGMVFQNYALFPHMSALENVAFPLRMRRVSSGECVSRARRILDVVGLAEHADRLPKQLSGGQQQRVALARALVFEPDVLLLDEPLSALDKNLREQMQLEIKRLHKSFGMTTIFVTHDQSEAMTMSDRIAVFNAGRVEQFAPALDVYATPATHFVGTFVGESNFFDVTASDPGAGRYDALDLQRTLAGVPTAHPRGSALSLMVRPESLRIADSLGTDDPNALDFEVGGIVDYGSSLLLDGRCSGQRVRMRVPRGGRTPYREGARYRITWHPEDAHVVPRP